MARREGLGLEVQGFLFGEVEGFERGQVADSGARALLPGWFPFTRRGVRVHKKPLHVQYSTRVVQRRAIHNMNLAEKATRNLIEMSVTTRLSTEQLLVSTMEIKGPICEVHLFRVDSKHFQNSRPAFGLGFRYRGTSLMRNAPPL